MAGKEIPDILGMTWEEGRALLQKSGIEYETILTRPPGHKSIDNTRRIIRIRHAGDVLEVVLADEKFPREQIQK